MCIIAGAKFKEHCFNIVELFWIECCFSGTTYRIITFLICIIIIVISSKTKTKFLKRERQSFLVWKAFQISSNYFLLYRHFNSRSRMTWRVGGLSGTRGGLNGAFMNDRASDISCAWCWWGNVGILKFYTSSLPAAPLHQCISQQMLRPRLSHRIHPLTKQNTWLSAEL